jgi:hypothetical protein
MRFDIYGRYRLDVVRETDSWVVYRLGEGKRRRDPELVIPSHLTADEIGTYLDDLFHEWAFPGAEIRRLD